MEEIKGLLIENKKQLILFSIITAALLTSVAGILVWKLPAAAVCVFVLLEAGLSVCLRELPVWLHGLILILQLLAGLMFGNGIFILVCTFFYIISVLCLHFLDK